MRDRKLFIIGNGFDLHHQIPTSFSDFKEFAQERHSDLLTAVEHYLLGIHDDWSDLESALASLDVQGIVNDLGLFMTSYGADDWSDSGHHDFQYEVDRVVECLSVQLRHRVAQWIRQLPIPTQAAAPLRLQSIDPTALFLTFNYTSTLETLYGVPDERILHIHGKAEFSDDAIILGHAWSPRERQSLGSRADIDSLDTRLAEAHAILDRYFINTFKPSSRLIEENKAFFRRLATVEEVHVLGHSLSAVDLPYFRAIVAVDGSASTRWHIACYQEIDFLSKPQALQGLGVGAKQITPRGWASF